MRAYPCVISAAHVVADIESGRWPNVCSTLAICVNGRPSTPKIAPTPRPLNSVGGGRPVIAMINAGCAERSAALLAKIIICLDDAQRPAKYASADACQIANLFYLAPIE